MGEGTGFPGGAAGRCIMTLPSTRLFFGFHAFRDKAIAVFLTVEFRRGIIFDLFADPGKASAIFFNISCQIKGFCKELIP